MPIKQQTTATIDGYAYITDPKKKQAARQEWWAKLSPMEQEKLKDRLTPCCRAYAGGRYVDGGYETKCTLCNRLIAKRPDKCEFPIPPVGLPLILRREFFRKDPYRAKWLEAYGQDDGPADFKEAAAGDTLPEKDAWGRVKKEVRKTGGEEEQVPF